MFEDDIEDDGFWDEPEEQLANIDGSAQESMYDNASGSLGLGEEGDSAADAFFASMEAGSPTPSIDGQPTRREAAKFKRKLANSRSKGAIGTALVDAFNGTQPDRVGPSIDNTMLREGDIQATSYALQLGRIGNLEYRIQAGIQQLLLGNDVEGIHPVDVAAAREQFAIEIGTKDLARFARDMRVDGAVNPPSQEMELSQIVSVLQNSSGTYMERGPGGALIGHNVYGKETEWQEEKQYKADSDLNTAIGYIKELSGRYLDERTIGSPVEASRRLALEESTTKRLLEGTFFDGSTNVLALPNETGVFGIKITQGIYSTPQGTAEDRLSSSQFDDLYQQVPTVSGQKTKFVRNDEGHRIFRDDVTETQRVDALRRIPSLANSLFPKPKPAKGQEFTDEEKAKHKRDQEFEMSNAQRMATFARKVLRQELLTNRDESKGNTQRMSGWDTPYGEQADLQNLRNEASIQGEEWNSFYSGQKDSDVKQSSMNDLVNEMGEKELSSRYVEPNTFDQSFPYKQGTAGWLRQREGKITASTAGNLLTEKGMDATVYTLARKRLSIEDADDDFVNNAHTREGNDGEGKARAAFMASKYAEGLTVEEAFFEENEKLPGFGVSPDGRLYDEEGRSAGLLELKFLSTDSMEGALNKYTEQLQFQMLVTGESQSHFYALDKLTGGFVHELVYADPAMQAELKARGFNALKEAGELNVKGVQTLRNQIISKKPRKRKGAKLEGQQEAFIIDEPVDKPMTAFQAAVMVSVSGASGASAGATKIAEKMEQEDQRDRLKDALKGATAPVDTDEDSMENERSRFSSSYARKGSDVKIGKARPFSSSYSKEGRGPSQPFESTLFKGKDEAALEKEKQDAQKEATENLKNFGKQLEQAASVAAELASVVIGGLNTGMDEVRAGAEAGMTAAQSRGAREALELGSLDKAGAISTISRAGQLQATFNDQAKAAAQFTTFMKDRGTSGNEAVKSLSLPNSPQEFAAMSPQQLMRKVASDVSAAGSPEDKQAIANFYGMPEMAVFDGDPSKLSSVDGSIGEAALRETNRQYQTFQQGKREAQEEISEQVNGGVLGGVETGAAMLGSATAGYLGSKLVNSSMASSFLSSASTTGAKAANSIKNLSTVAKLTPVAAVASIAPMAIRHFADVKDDGGLGDSALDIADFASYGAGVGGAIGLAFGGIGAIPGAAVGAAVGAGIGVANEAWEYFSADDVQPSTNIGAMPSQTRGEQTGKPSNVNVTVTNEISPELITTTTDVDGDISVDSDASLSTGG